MNRYIILAVLLVSVQQSVGAQSLDVRTAVGVFKQSSTPFERGHAADKLVELLTDPRVASVDKKYIAQEVANVAIESSRSKYLIGSDAVAILITAASERRQNPYATYFFVRQIFDRAREPGVRAAALNGIGALKAAESLPFLRQVAQDTTPNSFAYDAVLTIATLGEPGTRVLKELHDQGLVRDRDAKQWLARNKKRGYRPDR